MNQTSPIRTSLRARLRESLCDRGAEVMIVSFSAVYIGGSILRAGLQVHEDLLTMIGLLLLALPLVLAWIRSDPDEPERPDRPPQCTGTPGEIARMSDAEFDRLLDEVERQAPVPRRGLCRSHALAVISP